MGKNTYVAVGNKEDISDLITNISPKETPFFSACPKVKATATVHEWLEDSLRPAGENKNVEGFDYTVQDPSPRVRLDNVTQIFSAGYGITKTQETVSKHGVTSEIGYQMRKAMREIALDVEYAFIKHKAKVVGNATTARSMGGIGGFVTTNNIQGAPGPLTEAMMNDALEACWQVGGSPTKVYLSGKQKRKVSSWNGGGEKHLDQNSKKLINSISVYESDFGIVSFVPHRMMPDEEIFVIDPNFWKKAFLRPMHTEVLPNVSDNHKRVIVGELTLEARAEKASAKITKLTV